MKKNPKYLILGLFADFDQAFEVITDIRRYQVPGISVDDVTLRSPIEHPEIEDVLGERPTNITTWAFWGGLVGLVTTFFWLAAAQANFLVQPQGGKAVITVPSNLVLAYEMLILFGVLATLTGFITGARLMRKRGSLYSEQVSLDQIAILIEVENKSQRSSLLELFETHSVLEVREEDMA